MEKSWRKLFLWSFQHTYSLSLSTYDLNSWSGSRSQKFHRIIKVSSWNSVSRTDILHTVKNHRSAHEEAVWSESWKESHTTYNLIRKSLHYKCQNSHALRVKKPNISTLLIHLLFQCRKRKLPPKEKLQNNYISFWVKQLNVFCNKDSCRLDRMNNWGISLSFFRRFRVYKAFSIHW